MSTSDGNSESIGRIGGLAAWGVALTYFASVLSALLMPEELQASLDITPHEFWIVLSRDPMAHLSYHWACVLCGIFGIMAVPAISVTAWKASKNRGLILWSALLAWLGFAVLIRSHLMEVAWDRKIIPLYENADPAYQQAVHVVAGLALDIPDGLLTYAAIGIWVFIISISTFQRSEASFGFRVLGLISALSLIAGALGFVFLYRPFLIFGVGLGGLVLVPAWFIWAGILVRKSDC